jgi:hypothetical protein
LWHASRLSSSHPCHCLLLSNLCHCHLPVAPPPLAGGARLEVFSNLPPHSPEESALELTAAPLSLFLAPLPCHLARTTSLRSCSVAAPPASTGRPSYLGSAFSSTSLTRVAAGKHVRVAVGECGRARAGIAGKSAEELPPSSEAISGRDAPVCHLRPNLCACYHGGR